MPFTRVLGAQLLVAHQQQVLVGAAVLGFVIGGGLSILGGRKRRRR